MAQYIRINNNKKKKIKEITRHEKKQKMTLTSKVT